MSHIAELKALKDQCETTGACDPYYARLATEDARIDSNTTEANISIALGGIFAILVALTILFTAFVGPLRRMMGAVLPWALVLLPIIIGIGAGFFGGFLIAFGACFKQSCSAAEEYMPFILPALSLIVTIPLAVFIAHKRKPIKQTIYTAPRRVWVVFGVIALTLIALVVAAAFIDSAQENQHQKSVLRAYTNEKQYLTTN